MSEGQARKHLPREDEASEDQVREHQAGSGAGGGGGAVGGVERDDAGIDAADAADAADGDNGGGEGGRGLHSFPIQLNLSSSVHRITRLCS